MPQPVPSTPPPLDAPNRIIHYVGLGVLVALLIVGLFLIL
jgi:hypothetical protein